VVLNPGSPKWTDLIVFFFRSLTGQDVPDTFRAIVWTFNDAIGRLVDPTANLATLLTDSKTSMSVVALLKALGLQTLDINSELDALSTKVDAVNTALTNVNTTLDEIATKVDTVNVALTNVNTTLDEIATQSATIAADTADILIELRQAATPLLDEGVGLRTLTPVGRLAWVRWEMPGATVPRVEVIVGGSPVQVSAAATGEFSFNPPLPIDNYSISVDPGAAVNAIVNVGVIQ
jgi:hypothetical protein